MRRSANVRTVRLIEKVNYLLRRFISMNPAAPAAIAATAIPIIMYIVEKPSVTIGIKLTSGVRSNV